MFGNKKGLEEKLSKEGGIVAWATIIDADIRWTSGTNYENGPYTVGDHKHMTVKLKVEPEGEPEFEAKIRQTFVQHRPRPGGRAKVIYDPKDHSKIAILEDEVFMPGLSPDTQLRSRARVEEARAAMESGHLDEYIERQKAQAMAAANAAGGRERVLQGQRLVITGGDPGKSDIADELTKLAALRDRGVLSDAEFEAQKAKRLGAD